MGNILKNVITLDGSNFERCQRQILGQNILKTYVLYFISHYKRLFSHSKTWLYKQKKNKSSKESWLIRAKRFSVKMPINAVLDAVWIITRTKIPAVKEFHGRTVRRKSLLVENFLIFLIFWKKKCYFDNIGILEFLIFFLMLCNIIISIIITKTMIIILNIIAYICVLNIVSNIFNIGTLAFKN